uniref:Uncharacterized protein n=1 Tax=Rhizobium rhizogenes TaxID=359 RepID=A0A7S4ZVL0_RHIRH|nr:hypothetical protein [Rhizobium rhizogenes]QCL10591.1 hypothetical protein pC6.5d_698 [Rhizobium rhizogenes]
MGALAAAMCGTAAWADPYLEAIHGLMRASYQHLALTYACRDVTGMSQYREARVAAENAARATGMPTGVAMQTVEKMTARILATPVKNPHPSLNDCATGVTRTKQKLLAWRAKFRSAQQ